MVQFHPKLLGVLLTQNCRGRNGLLATRRTLLRVRSKGPFLKALGGSKISTPTCSMAGKLVLLLLVIPITFFFFCNLPKRGEIMKFSQLFMC